MKNRDIQAKLDLKAYAEERYDDIKTPLAILKLIFPDEIRKIKKRERNRDWYEKNKEHRRKYMKEVMRKRRGQTI